MFRSLLLQNTLSRKSNEIFYIESDIEILENEKDNLDSNYIEHIVSHKCDKIKCSSKNIIFELIEEKINHRQEKIKELNQIEVEINLIKYKLKEYAIEDIEIKLDKLLKNYEKHIISHECNKTCAEFLYLRNALNKNMREKERLQSIVI